MVHEHLHVAPIKDFDEFSTGPLSMDGVHHAENDEQSHQQSKENLFK